MKIGSGPYRAEALCGIAGREDIDQETRFELVEDIALGLLEEDRGWRLAECIGIIAKSSAKWPNGQPKLSLLDSLISLTGGLPEGDARVDALKSISTRVPSSRLPELLMLAIENRGKEAIAAKPVIRAIIGTGDSAMISKVAETMIEAESDLAVRLLLILHNGLEKEKITIEPRPLLMSIPFLIEADFETVRALCNNTNTADDVKLLADVLAGESEDAVRYTTTLAGRADRVGDPILARELLENAVKGLENLDGSVASKVTKNIAKGFEFLGDIERAEELRPKRMQHTTSTSKDTVVSRDIGHTIALVDTYEGAIGMAHMRALARAAGVAFGFGLKIALVGWPTLDLKDLCEKAEKETRTAGGNHLQSLLENGRLSLHSVEDILAGSSGHPIATTHQPAGGSVDLQAFSASGRLCMLMGLGRQGLPKRIMNGCNDHFELTGIGASLETAVAMGAIAQRLSQLD